MDNEICRKCQYCKVVSAMPTPPIFKFLGCYKGEYKGKWVVEIDKCPKEKPEENKGE